MKRLTGGIVANLEEARFAINADILQLVPTIFSFFGLVNIQIRGEKIGEAELALCPFREYESLEKDFAKTANFVKINGRYYLADYGSIRANALLMERIGRFVSICR